MSPQRPRFVVVTCEHAGNQVPPWLSASFRSTAARKALTSHRGIDLGAAALFRALRRGSGFSTAATTTRLAIDLNRSPRHPHLFSEFTRPLDPASRQRLLREEYSPYRNRVESAIAGAIDHGHSVVHLSVHTFTPALDGQTRPVEIGILYDPARPDETDFARDWIAALAGLPVTAGWRLRRNSPYRGTADGLVTALRRRFPRSRYSGLELEVNNRLASPTLYPGLTTALSTTFRHALAR